MLNYDIVSRSELMDAYGTCVGIAIVATSGLQNSAGKGRVVSSDLDMADAAVLCNVRISANHFTDRYSLLEWYKFGSKFWREIDYPSMSNASAPRTLKDFEKLPCGFWHHKYLNQESA